MAFKEGLAVEGGKKFARHFNFFAELLKKIGRHVIGKLRIIETVDRNGSGHLVAVGAVHDLQPVMQEVIGADELAPHADGPAGRADVDGEVFLDLVDDLERIPAFAVHLVEKVRIGRSRRRQTSNSLRVWLSTPLAPSITMMAASTAVSVR